MYIFSLIKLIKLLILNSFFFLVHLEQRFNKRHSSNCLWEKDFFDLYIRNNTKGRNDLRNACKQPNNLWSYCPRKAAGSYVSKSGMTEELSFDLLVLWIIMDMDESWCEEPQVFIYLAHLDYPLLSKSCQSKGICPYKSEHFFLSK